MARAASDVLAVLYLARKAALVEVDEEGRCSSGPIGVSPLFETIEDLEAAPEVLRELLEDPTYRSFLSARGGTYRKSCSVTAIRARTRGT